MFSGLVRAVVLLGAAALPVVAGDLPRNIKLEVRMEETLTSDSSSTGQRFAATLNKSISAGDAVMFERGATVEGVVKLAEPTFNYRQPGELDLELVSIRSKGKLYLLKTNMLVLQGRATATDPRTGRPMDPGSRKGDVARATIDTVPGMDRGGVATTIPGTDISVGSGSSNSRSMQVIVPAKSKLTFNVSSASTSDTTQ